MSFTETVGLVMDAIEFLKEIVEESPGEVQVTSSCVTYPEGLKVSTAPYLEVPFIDVVFVSPLDDERNLAHVAIVARGHYGARERVEGTDPANLHYEIASCAIGAQRLDGRVKLKPALEVTANAQPVLVTDVLKQPAIEWVVSLKCKNASGDGVLLAGTLDVTITAKIGSMGNVEFEGVDDRSEPPITCQPNGPMAPIALFIEWPNVYPGLGAAMT